jgi:hypothetical protein
MNPDFCKAELQAIGQRILNLIKRFFRTKRGQSHPAMTRVPPILDRLSSFPGTDVPGYSQSRHGACVTTNHRLISIPKILVPTPACPGRGKAISLLRR